MKKVSGRIKLELAQFRELEAFMQFAQDLDPDTKKQIARGERLTVALTQKNGMPLPFEEQVVVLYAAINGYLERVNVEHILEFEDKLLAFCDSSASEMLAQIRNTHDLDVQTESVLKNKLQKFEETHPNLFESPVPVHPA